MAKINNNSNGSGGVGFFGLLTLLLIGLKLTGSITWSWWWVLTFMWLPIVLFITILGLTAVSDKLDRKIKAEKEKMKAKEKMKEKMKMKAKVQEQGKDKRAQ
jgi:preprotein translocase subunit SecG